MITEIFSSIFASVVAIFEGSSLPAMVMIVIIAIFGGLRMKSISGIFGWVFESTLLLGFGLYLWDWLRASNAFSFATWEKETVRAWNNAMTVSVDELMGYFAMFFLLISIIHLVKRFARG